MTRPTPSTPTDNTWFWVFMFVAAACLAKCAGGCSAEAACAEELCPPGTSPIYITHENECFCAVHP